MAAVYVDIDQGAIVAARRYFFDAGTKRTDSVLKTDNNACRFTS
jgi:hypothetical protein